MVSVIDSFILSLKPELDPIDPKDTGKKCMILTHAINCKFLLILL